MIPADLAAGLTVAAFTIVVFLVMLMLPDFKEKAKK